MMWHDPVDDYINDITSDDELDEFICKLEELNCKEDFKSNTPNTIYNNQSNYSSSNNYQQRKYTTFYTKAVGVTYGSRQRNISTLQTGQQLKLVHETNNQYDSNALLITTNSGLEIGYVSKEYNKDILNKMNSNLIKSVTVANVTGEGYANKGVNIKVEIFNTNNTLETHPKDSVSNATPVTESSNNETEPLPLGCLGVIAIVILVLTIGFSGGITSW